MSLSDRRTVLALLAGASLAGCGFTPAYQSGTPARGLRGAVLVDPPATRADFDLIRAVEDRLGRPTVARYGLSVSQAVSQSALAVQGTAAITRYNLIGKAGFVLRDLRTGTDLHSGEVETFTSYSATGSTIGTASAERDARRRLASALGDLIVTDILMHLPQTPPAEVES